MEWIRRIVMFREDPPALHMPGGFTWEDSQGILYGSDHSAMFDGLQWGGMSMSSDVYVQQSVDLDLIQQESQGNVSTRIPNSLCFNFYSSYDCSGAFSPKWVTDRVMPVAMNRR